MKKARITTKPGKMTPNGRERIMELRAGEKGTGKLIGSVAYWPWSSRSCDEADRIIEAKAEKEGVEIVQEEPEY